jgi:hypothetical protein
MTTTTFDIFIRLLILVQGDDHGLDHVLQLDEVAERFIL